MRRVAAHAWDIAHGYVTTATGTLAATDVDHNAVQTWSGDANGVYGTFAIDAGTGQWTHTLDDTRPRRRWRRAMRRPRPLRDGDR
jgi:hypothetical protein